MEQGERAIRAHLKAEPAAAKKASCLNEAVSNRTDEVLSQQDAEILLRSPENIVQACGEAIRPNFRLPHIVDTLQEPTMIGPHAWPISNSQRPPRVAYSFIFRRFRSCVPPARDSIGVKVLSAIRRYPPPQGHTCLRMLIRLSRNLQAEALAFKT